MQKVTVSLAVSPGNDYTIFIGDDAIETIGSLFDFGRYSKLFIVTDRTVKPLLLGKLASALPTAAAVVVLPDGEKHKTIENIQKIWTAMHAASCDRKSLVINLGGGVVGDMGGFAAATYMRGVDFLNVPTTLLAQVDASVGGKTGFNFDGIKNLVGTFGQPVGVVIDPRTLADLPQREFLSGFAEIIKHGLVADKSYFDEVTAKPPLQFTKAKLEDIIARSCRIKAGIVQGDVAEGGSRKLVNFGHTVGHAVEALSLETDRPLLHGEAVSIGMLAEARISQQVTRLSAADVQQIQQALDGAGLPTTAANLPIDAILAKMQSDKKNDNGQVNFTLLDGIGRAVYNQKVDQAIVIEALEAVTRKKP